MKREGIAFLSIALILLVFATLSTVFIYNMSKDVFRSQQQAVKAKVSFYSKIAILSTINLAENNRNELTSNDTGTITGLFKLKLNAPDDTGVNAFPVPLGDTEILNTINITISSEKETKDALDASVYLTIDSTQTDLGLPGIMTSTWYPEENSVFVDSLNNLTHTSKTSGEFIESVIYRME